MRAPKILVLTAIAAIALGLAATAAAATRVTTTATFPGGVTLTPTAPTRTADGNTFRYVLACGTGVLANGGSYSYCEDDTAILHPNSTFNIHGAGTITGSFPGCGEQTFDYVADSHGTVGPGGLAGPVQAGSTGSGAFHFEEKGLIQDGSTITYAC